MQLEPEDAMETVDEGRVERMASGGVSSHQDQETNDEKSTEQSKPGDDTAFSSGPRSPADKDFPRPHLRLM